MVSTHSASSLAAQRGRDQHDDPVAVAVRRDGPAAPLRAAYLHLVARAHRPNYPVRRPREEALPRPGVDDPVGLDAGLLGALAAVVEQVELARRVRVAVDREQAADVAGQLEQPRGRVAALGPGVDLDGDVVLDAGLEDGPRVELRCPGALPRLPVTSRPVQWPSTFVSGLRIAPIIRRVIARASIFSLECTLATRTSSRPSSSSVWSSAAVVEDVDLDALEQREAEPPRWLVDRVDDVELAGQPLGAEPVGDGQPRRVVGEHEVVVAELDRR